MPTPSLRPFRVKVTKAYRTLGERGLITHSSGNVSLRVGEAILITPTGIPYYFLRPAQIVVIDKEGGVRGFGRPSSEWRVHVAVLRARPEVRAVVHTHSPYATAVACSLPSLPVLHDEGRIFFGGEIPVAEHAPPGTWELAQRAVAALGKGRAILLSRHGVLTVGKTLDEAVFLAEKVEEAAQLFLLSRDWRGP
ncbi:class II aldolase/adducin family protein [Candidatus Bipolaricaulota bacterium]|nr:class II aldolase/adducin family protein [Candidatus Bipolaricaulota bacterium]